MVVFTCQSCGDSLQKPKVEKHLQFVCRNSSLLTCVDCLKDFRGIEYVGHTQCVTELQRYSAKGFVPEPNSQKGLYKQNMWTDMIKKVLEHTDLNAQQHSLLNAISSFQNIPRKRHKFYNFMKNVTKCNVSTADDIFDLLEAEWNKANKSNEEENGVSTKLVISSHKTMTKNKNEINSEERDRPIETSKNCNEVKKKGNMGNEIKSRLDGESEDNELNNKTDINQQDKRQAEVGEDKTLSKKEKKQKRKREKYLAEINSIENDMEFGSTEHVGSGTNSDLHKKIKKQKRKKSVETNERTPKENDGTDVCIELEESQKKKRKHDKDNSYEETQKNQSKKIKLKECHSTNIKEEDVKEENTTNDHNKITVFSWNDVIIQVLQSRSDKELSLKKLCKKVLAEYYTVKGYEQHESYEKLMAKFHKKVNKTVGVRVIKDRAKLIS